jgi:hypothetical protein
MIRTRFAKLGYVDTRLDVDTNNIEMTVTALGSAFISMTVDETKEFINVLYRLVKDADEDNERMKRYIDRFNRRTAELNETRASKPINNPRWPVNEIPLPPAPVVLAEVIAAWDKPHYGDKDAQLDNVGEAIAKARKVMNPEPNTAEFVKTINNLMDKGELLESKTYAHTEETCPSKHWNDGTDVCADCGADLNAPYEPQLTYLVTYNNDFDESAYAFRTREEAVAHIAETFETECEPDTEAFWVEVTGNYAATGDWKGFMFYSLDAGTMKITDISGPQGGK